MTSVGRETAAIVGVGNTDYGADYRVRDVQREALDLAQLAFERALDDSGLQASDIDGIAMNPIIPGSNGLTPGTIAERMGIKDPWTTNSGLFGDLTAALEAGEATTIALVYGTAQRSSRVDYGGSNGRTSHLSYVYYHPWGFSSQAAHWALMFRRHQLLYGSTEEQLGAGPIAQRKAALLNPYAVMRDPMTMDDYLASRYIVRPLRLFDLCIVNDGGVVVILRRADRSHDLRQAPVFVSGTGAARGHRDVAQLRPLVLDQQRELVGAAAAQALAQAGMTVANIDHVQAYDASSVNLPMALEGAGFCKPGEGFEFMQDGRIEIGGELPCNTSGGLLSESYMHGQNFTVEAVRQLRHQAGDRQVVGAEASIYLMFTSAAANAVVYRRGA